MAGPRLMRNEPWVWRLKVGDAGTSGAGAVPLRSADDGTANKKQTKGGGGEDEDAGGGLGEEEKKEEEEEDCSRQLSASRISAVFSPRLPPPPPPPAPSPPISPPQPPA